jgi:hypothetical protein
MYALANCAALGRQRGISLFCIVLFATVLSMTVVVQASDVDTEHLFGFTTGSDIGDVGEKEVESETTGRFGKRSGSYGALSQIFEFKYTPVDNFRVFGGVGLAYYDISGVPGLDNRRQGMFQGLSLGAAYRLLERETAPFGLSVAAEPRWGRTDETSGAPVDSYGVDFTISADKEVVVDRIFGAFNLLYQPDAARSRLTGTWQHQSSFGISSALSTQVRPGMFVGAEAISPQL